MSDATDSTFVSSATPSRLRRSKESSSKKSADRTRIPFAVNDIASLAKSLRASLETHAAPSQVQMLNWLAKGAGFQNYQSLRAHAARSTPTAKADAPSRDTTPTTASEMTVTPLSAHAAKALTQFDVQGRLHKWPHKFAVQRVAMWGLWLRFDAKKIYSEKEVNSVLKAWHTYGDHVTLRRELVNMQLVARKADCSAYWKVVQQPSDDVKAFLKALRAQTER